MDNSSKASRSVFEAVVEKLVQVSKLSGECKNLLQNLPLKAAGDVGEESGSATDEQALRPSVDFTTKALLDVVTSAAGLEELRRASVGAPNGVAHLAELEGGIHVEHTDEVFLKDAAKCYIENNPDIVATKPHRYMAAAPSAANVAGGQAVSLSSIDAIVAHYLELHAQMDDAGLVQYSLCEDDESEPRYHEVEVAQLLRASMSNARAAVKGRPTEVEPFGPHVDPWLDRFPCFDPARKVPDAHDGVIPWGIRFRPNSQPKVQHYESTVSPTSGAKELHRNSFDRLLHRAGVIVADDSVYQVAQELMDIFLRQVLFATITVAKSRGRRANTVLCTDVVRGLWHTSGHKVTLYGFGVPNLGRGLFSCLVPKILPQIHPDNAGFDPVGLAVFDDILSDLLGRVVDTATNVAARGEMHLPSPEQLRLGGGQTALEMCRTHTMKNVAVPDPTISEPPTPSGVTAPLLVKRDEDFSTYCYEDFLHVKESKEVLAANCVSSRDIETAVRLVYPGQLARHAIMDGTKSVTKFSMVDTPHGKSMAAQAGLQFPPEAVAAMASKLRRGVRMTKGAATYLAATLEYITAELIELSGQCADAERKHTGQPCRISARHLHRVILLDDEFCPLFGTAIFRAGSNLDKNTSSQICATPLKELGAALDGKDGGKTPSFGEVFVGMLKAASKTEESDKCLIDPRDGLHKMLMERDGEPYLVGAPARDAASGMSAVARKILAIEALTPSQLASFHSSEADPQQVREARAALIRLEQKRMDAAFSAPAFAKRVKHIAEEIQSGMAFTAESFSALQCAAEGRLIAQFRAALRRSSATPSAVLATGALKALM